MLKVLCRVGLFLLSTSSLMAYTFHTSKETLESIRRVIESERKGVYFRFGDGELLTALGKGHSQHQPYSSSLQQEIRACVAMNGPNIFKSLPLYHPSFGGYERGMFPGNHEMSAAECERFLTNAKGIWGAPIEDVYSHVALSYLAAHDRSDCLRFLHFLKKSQVVLLVGNQHIPREIRTLLFGEGCAFIPTKPFDAYSEIDSIQAQADEILQKSSGYKIVVTSTGVCGKALQRRLYETYEDIFLFDFGSLMDALFNAWDYTDKTRKRAWIELSGFDKELFLGAYREMENEEC